MSIPVSMGGFGRCPRIAYWLILATLNQGVVGCGDSEKDEAACPPLAKQEKPKTPAPLRVRMVVPYNGNMPGLMAYRASMGVNTAFQKRLGQLIYEMNANPAVRDRTFYLVDQTVHVNERPIKEVQGRINGTQPAGYGAGIGIAALLDSALSLADANKVVTVIATDMVDHSPNRRVLAALEDDVKNALAPLRRHGLSASLYADTSQFYGEYFAAFQQPVKKQEVRGATIPYYLWVIGPPEMVGRFNQKILRDAPVRQMHFNTQADVPYAALLKNVTPAPEGGAYESAPNQLTLDDLSASPSAFTIGLDLSALPAALRSTESLRSLTATAAGAQVSLVGTPHKLTAAHATPALSGFTHTVRVRVTKLDAPCTLLTLTLPAPGLPAWVREQSTDDDRKPGKHTYRLETILTGAHQAVGDDAPAVFRCQLQLKKGDD